VSIIANRGVTTDRFGRWLVVEDGRLDSLRPWGEYVATSKERRTLAELGGSMSNSIWPCVLLTPPAVSLSLTLH
jgi:hypothetical protein